MIHDWFFNWFAMWFTDSLIYYSFNRWAEHTLVCFPKTFQKFYRSNVCECERESDLRRRVEEKYLRFKGMLATFYLCQRFYLTAISEIPYKRTRIIVADFARISRRFYTILTQMSVFSNNMVFLARSLNFAIFFQKWKMKMKLSITLLDKIHRMFFCGLYAFCIFLKTQSVLTTHLLSK